MARHGDLGVAIGEHHPELTGDFLPDGGLATPIIPTRAICPRIASPFRIPAVMA